MLISAIPHTNTHHSPIPSRAN